ncbi:hypothetical protein GCM10028778_21700 [Barrientosiimonas marina]|uniref:Uncharacterized protein n=2 Tax=Lentibacillus kimchii TaxID=1542911 RepID=A0ABW2UXY3_9BACI
MRIFGYILLVSGTILFGIMHLAIALYLPDLGGWGDPPGLIATVLSDIAGWIPYILSIVFMVTGIILIAYDFISNSKWGQKQKDEMKARNREFNTSREENRKR